MRVPSVSAPVLDLVLYEDSVLRDSREAFARIRDAGPVVWLPRHRMYAIGPFDDVRLALRDDETFVSGKGVAVNRLTNLLARGTTLFSDGDTHVAGRNVLKRSLGAKALTAIEDRIDKQARALIDRLAAEREFEAARDFASHLPLSIVAQLVGVHANGNQLLKWAAASFYSLGPLNRRGLRAAAPGLKLLLYTQRLKAERLAPGSWAASVF